MADAYYPATDPKRRAARRARSVAADALARRRKSRGDRRAQRNRRFRAVAAMFPQLLVAEAA